MKLERLSGLLDFTILSKFPIVTSSSELRLIFFLRHSYHRAFY